MKNTSLIILVFSLHAMFALNSQCQSIERSAISSYGNIYTNANMQYDATIGEMIIFTGESADNYLTQGFQQPQSIVSLCKDPHQETINISACVNYILNDVTYDVSGSYMQTLTAEDGCDSVIYLNLQLNTLNNQVTSIENTLIATQENASYAWTLCGADEILSTSQVFTPSENGEYQVTITQEDCEVVSECVSFVVGVDEVNEKIALHIFPNPVRDILQLETIGNVKNASIILYDAMGNEVLQEKINTNITSISIEHLAAGPYFLVLFSNENICSRYIVKQ